PRQWIPETVRRPESRADDARISLPPHAARAWILLPLRRHAHRRARLSLGDFIYRHRSPPPRRSTRPRILRLQSHPPPRHRDLRARRLEVDADWRRNSRPRIQARSGLPQITLGFLF